MPRLTELLELSRLAAEDAARYPKRRWLASALENAPGKHFIGILGPRGAGKTVLLRQQLLRREDTFYLSLDTLGDHDLFDLAKQLHQDYKIDCLLLDEVHYLADFDAQLKKIYDFLDVQVVFTSSMALAMQASAHDLSRRVRLERLTHFSLREYVWFKQGWQLPRLSLGDIRDRRWTRRHLACASWFDEYLRGRCLTFSLEEPDPLPILENILHKILTGDVPKVARLTHEEVDHMFRMLRFVGRSSVDGINYSSLSRNVGITKYKAASYTDILEQAFVLHVIDPKGANVMRQPKVLMQVPYRLLYLDWHEALGGLREDFFADCMRAAGIGFHYLKTTRGSKTPDYLLRTEDGTELVIEIGGKGKGRSQFKGYRAHHKLIFSNRESTGGMYRPLFLLGLLA